MRIGDVQDIHLRRVLRDPSLNEIDRFNEVKKRTEVIEAEARK